MALLLRTSGTMRSPHRAASRRARSVLAAGALTLAVTGGLARPAAAADEDRAASENEFGVEVAARGLWKEASYRWERAVELDPMNAKAYNNLGVGYERAGEFEKAMDAYETALELLPSNERIRQNYELFREAYERKLRKERDAARSARSR